MSEQCLFGRSFNDAAKKVYLVDLRPIEAKSGSDQAIRLMFSTCSRTEKVTNADQERQTELVRANFLQKLDV